MLEATMEETALAVQQQSAASDKGLVVVFSKKSHHNDAKSREQGRAIFEMVDYIEIWVPGDKANSVSRPVREEDKSRFHEQWRRYVDSNQEVVGTPLSTWGLLTPAQVDELKYFKVLTIEQLASISDANAQGILGINSLRDKAKAHLQLMNEAAPMQKLQAELSKRDEMIATQAKQIKDLQEAVEKLRADSEE